MVERKYNITIWLITPPNNMKTFINEFARQWQPNHVNIIACHNVKQERLLTGYTCECSNVDNIYILDEIKQKKKFVKQYIDNHIQDIHVFGGLRKEPAPYMYYMKRKYGDKTKIVAYTEKPAYSSGGWCKRILKKYANKIIYPYVFFRAMRVVDYLFVVGLAGVEKFNELGWKKNNIYNFMYCDNFAESEDSKLLVINEPIKFLYVGRFDYRMRGLDVIMNAFDKIESKNWELHLVGGYGPQKEEVISWSDTKPNVYFGGTWKSSEVMDKMHGYDIYICASKEDSWNGQINMALSAGLGVITSDEAGSDELVTASKAGMVIHSGNIDELVNAIEYVIVHPEKVYDWKKKAVTYSPRIGAESVATYFCKMLEYFYCGAKQMPECPWL